jgi:hypothetical protein
MERSGLDLFLEKILKCLAGIAGTRNVPGGNRWSRNGGRGRRIFFDRGAEFVEPAIVPLVLARNAFGNRLHAFKSRARIEIRALLAGMQFVSALRTLPFRIETGLQHGAAIRASRTRDGADHARRARSDLILSRVAFWRPFLFFLGLVGRAHVAPLPILPLQMNLRGGCTHHTRNRMVQHKKRPKPVNNHAGRE